MKKILYCLYELCVMPLFLIDTIATALLTIIGCRVGNGHFWGYYPGKWWSQFTIRLLLLPVKVEGREHLKPGQSYLSHLWFPQPQLQVDDEAGYR